MAEISGGGSINPSDKKMYEQEYRHGAELFQKAVSEYAKSTNPFQKAEFKDVMEKSLNVMNETASALMRKSLQKQNDVIAQDYAIFSKDPDDKFIQQKLTQDLARAKRSV